MNKLLLKVVPTMVFVCLLAVSAISVRAASGMLTEVHGRKSLKIDTKRIKYREDMAPLVRINPKEGEVRVPTANPRVIAFVGYDERGTCKLRVFDGKGDALSVINCESDLVTIPADKDIIWVSGKRWSEGVLEHGKPSPFAGLYVYSFKGQKISTIDKGTTGVVSQLQALQDGSVVLLHSARTFRGITKLTPQGDAEWQLPIADPVVRMSVFNNGEFIATQVLLFKEGKKKASLYGPQRRLVIERSGPSEESQEIVAVTADGTHFVLATGRGRKQVLEVFLTRDSAKALRKLDLDARLEKLALDNNLRLLAAQFPDGFRVLDFEGNPLAEGLPVCRTTVDLI